MALGDAFTHLVQSKGWGRQVNLHLVLSRWPELVGPTNAEHSRPVKYQGTVLTVRTEATVWATSLRTIAPQLVAELNRRLGEGPLLGSLLRAKCSQLEAWASVGTGKRAARYLRMRWKSSHVD